MQGENFQTVIENGMQYEGNNFQMIIKNGINKADSNGVKTKTKSTEAWLGQIDTC